MVVTKKELESAFAFLVVKVLDMDLQTDDGHDICPMFGFCENEDNCILDRIMDDTQEKNVKAVRKSRKWC